MTELELVEYIKHKKEEGLGDTRIGKLLGLSKDKIKYIRRKYNIEGIKVYEYTKDDFLKLLGNDLHDSKSKKELANKSGISISELNKYLKMFNIDFKPNLFCPCGKKIEQKGTGKPKYCSEKCRYIYHKKPIDELKRKPKKIICKQCGKEFVRKGKERLCGDDCRKESLRVSAKKRGMETRVCETCGTEFEVSKTSDKRICSLKCKGGLINHKADGILMNVFGTLDESVIKEIVRRRVKCLLSD